MNDHFKNLIQNRHAKQSHMAFTQDLGIITISSC